MVENILVQPGEAAARVIINSRTGTVVIGEKVRILPAAISHGSLVVTISQAVQVSQPPALSGGSTAVTANSDVDVTMEGDRMFVLNTGITLQDVVDAVNRVGATPADLVSILQALKGAGALRAELIVI